MGELVFGTSAKDDNDIAIYDKTSGNLWIDYDANGPDAKVLLVTLAPGIDQAASDIILITEGDFNRQISGVEQSLLVQGQDAAWQRAACC
ncbi:MAG: hypothetical protein ACKVOL_07940 [Novosphingobium sp.]